MPGGQNRPPKDCNVARSVALENVKENTIDKLFTVF